MELRDMTMRHNRSRKKGFTIIELLIALALTVFVSAGIYTAYITQVRSYTVQERVAEMQQNLRAAMITMVDEMRIAGYDPLRAGGFGITDIRPRDVNYAVNVTIAGNSALVRTADDGAGGNTGNGVMDGDETIIYYIFDFNADGIPDLARDDDGVLNANDLLAEGIQSLGFAYAFDAPDPGTGGPPDGNLDTYNVGGNAVVIWAIDSDGDNDLDLNLDTDNDGIINAADDTDGNGIIDGGAAEGQGLANFSGVAIPDVSTANIRAVRIWILGITLHPDRSFSNQGTSYVVGKKVFRPNDNLRRRLLSTIVKYRNMGL